MKKIGLFVLICAVALALGACGGNSADTTDSKYVGTWKVDTISFQDTSEAFDTEWTLVINEDGTGQTMSEGETADFTWTPTDKGFKTKGGIKTDFVDDGDAIMTKIIGVELRFNKVE